MAVVLYFSWPQLQWILFPGVHLDDRSWQKLLKQKMFLFFFKCHAFAGFEPAAAYAAAAAAAHHKRFTVWDVLTFLATACGTLLTVWFKAMKKLVSFYWSR